MIFFLKSLLNAEIVYYNFNFAFNYKNANQYLNDINFLYPL